MDYKKKYERCCYNCKYRFGNKNRKPCDKKFSVKMCEDFEFDAQLKSN